MHLDCFCHKLNFTAHDANKKYWSFWAHRLTLDFFPFLLFLIFSLHLFLYSRCGFWDFRSLRFHFTKHTENLSSSLSLKNAFDLCVIISIVLERFMKIMTGSCAHWYSNMSSLLVTWTICHFTKPLSIIQSNYNSFWDYAIFTRLFDKQDRGFFVVFIFFLTDKAISGDNNHSYSSDISILMMTLLNNWCKSQYGQICIRRNKCLFFLWSNCDALAS